MTDRRYAVFGGVLASAFDFPELREAGDGVDWTLAEATSTGSALGEELGSHRISTACVSRLFRTDDGLALTFDDTGRFDIPSTGRVIRWHRGPNPDEAAMRTDVLGRCLALAMHQRGMLSLHAAGLALPGGAIGLVAPSGTGKSSLAMALVRAGAKLLTDDTLPVELGPPVLARPGVQSIRLRDDSAAVLGGDERFTPEVWGKREYRELPDDARAPEAVPLAAIYFLAPAPADAERAIESQPLPGFVASIALIGQHKLGALLGGSEAAPTLARAAALARAVPVRKLLVARDLARLPDAARELASWHGG